MTTLIESCEFPLRPGRLWSLWDMIKTSFATFLSLGMNTQGVLTIFQMLENSGHTGALPPPPGHKQIELMGPDEKAGLIETLKGASKVAQALGLSVSVAELQHAIKDPPETQRELKTVLRAFRSELDSLLCLAIPPHLVRYYENDGIVSDITGLAFPSASEEIRNAGTCFSTGLNTACVFHAMRAAEIGLRALATTFELKLREGKTIETADWKDILDALGNAARDIENRPNSDPKKQDDMLFFSEAAAQFRFFKNGWRVRVSHARATYNEAQAREALDHVASFLEVLAKRAYEPESPLA